MATYKIEPRTPAALQVQRIYKGNIEDVGPPFHRVVAFAFENTHERVPPTQGHVRVAAISDPSGGHSTTYWRHLACMTEKVVRAPTSPPSPAPSLSFPGLS